MRKCLCNLIGSVWIVYSFYIYLSGVNCVLLDWSPLSQTHILFFYSLRFVVHNKSLYLLLFNLDKYDYKEFFQLRTLLLNLLCWIWENDTLKIFCFIIKTLLKHTHFTPFFDIQGNYQYQIPLRDDLHAFHWIWFVNVTKRLLCRDNNNNNKMSDSNTG